MKFTIPPKTIIYTDSGGYNNFCFAFSDIWIEIQSFQVPGKVLYIGNPWTGWRKWTAHNAYKIAIIGKAKIDNIKYLCCICIQEKAIEACIIFIEIMVSFYVC